MGLVLRKNIGTKLTIADLDNNFEYLDGRIDVNSTDIQTLNSDVQTLNSDVSDLSGRIDYLYNTLDPIGIDLHWSKDHMDQVSDELYIKHQDQWYPSTFTSRVYQLGVSIRNYDLIKDHNPEIIIERFKKPTKTRVNNNDHYSPARFSQTFPYNDYTHSETMNNINPSKANFLRPMIIPVTGTFSYYRIYAENYFSPINPPKVAGCGSSFYTISKTTTRTIYDDTNTYSIDIPKHQKGTAHCRMSIRISDGSGGHLYSKPLVNFKIKMIYDPQIVLVNYSLI